MAGLPDFRDLGALPSAGGAMPIGRPDPSPIARGAQALAAGAVNLGKGVSALGEGVGQLGIDEQRYEYATAHADFLAKKIDLDSSLQHDQDYATLPQRYGEAVTGLQTDVARSITNPAMRGRFMQSTAVQVAQGNATATQHAFTLEGNAKVAETQAGGDDLINKVITLPVDSPDREAAIAAHSNRLAALRAQGFITPQQELAERRQWADRFAIADGLERSKTDPLGVMNDLRAAPGSPEQITNRILQLEGTGQNPRSSAVGAGQFIDKTWLDVIKRNRPDLAAGRSDQELLALRADRRLGAEMTEANRRENEGFLRSKGIEPTAGAQYLAHFLGPAGAEAVLTANPRLPVDQALAAKVGPDKARQMIESNPTVLRGQLAGTVSQWADAKMGGVGPGGGHLYDILRPDQRAMLLSHAEGELRRQQVSDISDFKLRLTDSQAEAMRTGAVANPIAREEFISRLGPDDGPKAYATYQQNVALGRDKAHVSELSPTEQYELLQRYEPQPGSEGYADQGKRRDQLAQAIDDARTERDKDPAGFAINRLPASGEAWQKFGQTLSDPKASDADRGAAARAYADRTIAEQAHAGVMPDAQRIVPKDYVDGFTKTLAAAADSEEPGKRVALIGEIKREAAMWGDNWPAVMRQMADKSQPLVRAIAAGADEGAMTRLLSLPKDASPKSIVGEQNETKLRDVTTEVNNAMKPFRDSMVGRQLDRDFPGYEGLALKLTALHVRDGASASDAAAKAFNELIGNRYDFRDTWRIPKSAGVAADDVQAGTVAAQLAIRQMATTPSNLAAAHADMSLTPQEKALYQRHLTNLTGAGGVDNADGSRSSLFAVTAGFGDRTYVLPTVREGKILKPEEAVSRARAEGIDTFPSYGSEAEAKARYDKMHGYMEKDTEQFLQGRKAEPLARIVPAIDDMGLRETNRADSFSKYARDGRWVTSADNGGLNLVYGDKFVRTEGGAPLFMSWADLAKRGTTPEARAATQQQLTQSGGAGPLP